MRIIKDKSLYVDIKCRCYDCGEEKYTAEFYARGRFHGRCRNCCRRYARERGRRIGGYGPRKTVKPKSTRRCYRCKITMAVSEFYGDKYMCRTCWKAYSKAVRAGRPARKAALALYRDLVRQCLQENIGVELIVELSPTHHLDMELSEAFRDYGTDCSRYRTGRRQQAAKVLMELRILKGSKLVVPGGRHDNIMAGIADRIINGEL